jgi:hypothetical protein
MELMAFRLHRPGAARAQAVSFVSDGAPWIWNRRDWVIGRAGLDPRRVERAPDCYHAAHHVSLASQALGSAEAARTATYQTLRHQSRAGRSREVVATLRRMAQAQPFDSGVWVELESLDQHEAHLRYDWFGYRGHPLGSVAVEGAIRRVINPRLKGNGIYWREEDAEAMLVSRAAALTGRWEETRERGQEAMAPRPAVGGARHRGGVELGCSDQAASVATRILRPGKDHRGVTLFGYPPRDHLSVDPIPVGPEETHRARKRRRQGTYLLPSGKADQ